MVEWKKLGEICKVHTGSQLNRTNMFDEGRVPVLNGGREYSGYTDRNNEQANTITISQGGESAGFVNWVDVDFWAGAHCYVVEKNDTFNNRYLYHALKNKEREIRVSKQGAGIPGLNRDTLYKQIIPIPSLSEQTRIVGILDTFTSAIDNLKAQIAQRRKQYEYYRDQLLDLDGKDGVERKNLGDVCGIFDGTHQTPKYTDSGIRFVSVENINSLYDSEKYISTEDFNAQYKTKPQKGDVLMTRIGDVGTCAVINREEPIAYYVSLALLKPNKDYVINFYIKYILESRIGKIELRKRTLLTAVPLKINLGDVGKITIPIPSLSEQQRIVSILDTFEASIQNLEAQLKQREKQYEYYRNQLLTFE